MGKEQDIKKIFDTMELALARAGFRLIDRHRDTLIIRDKEEDRDFRIIVEEIPG